MKFGIALILAAFTVGLISDPALAQAQGGPSGGPSGPGPTVAPGTQMGTYNLTPEQFNKLQDYAEFSKRLSNEDKASGKTLADLLAEDKATASTLAAEMPLSCQVNEAILAAQGPLTVDGKTVNTKTYEVACANGMGYFLVSQEPGKPYAISCFAADATRAADVAAGRKPGTVCTLPPNADMNAMATSLMDRAGKSCAVRDHRWLGQSTVSKAEYDEVACSDRSGYVMSIALTGSVAPVRVSTCHDSAMRGLLCKMSDNGVLGVTLQTFKDALQQYNVACDAGGDENIRVIGQENVQKRYVVEFRCPQRPSGLVAFIPLNGSTAPFEALDCKAAARRQVACKLTTN